MVSSLYCTRQYLNPICHGVLLPYMGWSCPAHFPALTKFKSVHTILLVLNYFPPLTPLPQMQCCKPIVTLLACVLMVDELSRFHCILFYTMWVVMCSNSTRIHSVFFFFCFLNNEGSVRILNNILSD